MSNTEIKSRRDLWQLFGIPIKSEEMTCHFVAEIGVAEGRFSQELLDWGIGRLYMVDRWECVITQKGDAAQPPAWHAANFHRCWQIANRDKRAVLLRGDSVSAADLVDTCSLSLAYIDADHSYEGVIRDLTAWYPKVTLGGIIAVHDYDNPAYGVKKALREFCHYHDKEIFRIPENGDDSGAWFRV